MCLIPAAVRARLEDSQSAAHFRSQGPVDACGAGQVDGPLAGLAARAVLHGQRELALALCQALEALSHVADQGAAVA